MLEKLVFVPLYSTSIPIIVPYLHLSLSWPLTNSTSFSAGRNFTTPLPQDSFHFQMAPRYWCKVCAVFVTDTTFERKVHEETAKHKSAWKQHLRGLYESSKEEGAKKDDLEREMAEIRKKVAQDGYEGMDKPLEAKSGSQDPAVAPKKTFYDKMEEKSKQDEKKPVIDTNIGTGVWESVQVIPPAAPPVVDGSEGVSEYVLSASKRAQKVNDEESTRWKIQEKQLEDDDLVLNRKRKLGSDSDRKGIKVDLKQEDGVKKEEVEMKTEDTDVKKEEGESKGSMFKRKKKKIKS